MNCNEKEDLLIGYLANILEQEESEKLEVHLTSCHECQRRLNELNKARALLRQWKPVIPPSDLKQKVLDNIKAQKLIEEKTSQESRSKDIPMERMFEWLRKMVSSEQLRIYKILTDFLGKEKGEEVFDYYLEEQMKVKLLDSAEEAFTGWQIVAKSLGIEVERTRLKGGVTKETIRHCSYLSVAKELGMKVSPCEAICLRQARLIEKYQPVKVNLIKKMPNEEGVCVFLFRSLESKPS